MDFGAGAKGPKMDLRPCKHCGRTFNPESLAKHQANCQNVQKKRKVFDTSKQRATEDLSVRQIKAAQKKAEAEQKKKAVAPPKSNWRQKHSDFINAIRGAKTAQVAMDRGDPLPPPPPPAENPDYITCPYCSRRFNEKAAERHIDFCKTKQKRITPQRQPTEQEKKRAAATKYQPPKPKVRGAADSPSAGGGGYSSGGGGGYSSGGGSGGYGAAPRGAPGARAAPAPAGSRSDMGRAPAGYGQSPAAGAPRGRAPAGGVARGRPTPASQGSYAPAAYADSSSKHNTNISSPQDPLRVLSGSSMKLRQHAEASKTNSRKVVTQRQSILSSTRVGTGGKPQKSSNKYSSSSSSSGNGLRGTDSGYHSSTSEFEPAVPRIRKTTSTRPGSGVAKFCHECGTKYPVTQARFCGECGQKRADIPIR